jgi:hypothetical protein
MSLVFNEAALINLLEAPNGPYGNRLRLVAETITANYNAAIAGVWQNQPASIQPEADYDIGIGQYGLQATIGIVPSERVRRDGKPNASEYMDNKFGNIEPDKFQPKIMAGWDAQL